MVIFTCYLYSGGMPLLNVFCFFTLVFLYWIDKYLILHHYKKPPRYSPIFNDRILVVLPYAVILHCAFALYMFGSESIFPTGFHMAHSREEDWDYVVPNKEDFLDRIYR